MADYKVTLPNADPVMVRANNKAQAIRFVTHNKVAIEILTTEDAIKLAKAGQELLDATGTPEEPEQPLLEPPGGEDEQPDDEGRDAVSESGNLVGAAEDKEPAEEEKPKATGKK